MMESDNSSSETADLLNENKPSLKVALHNKRWMLLVAQVLLQFLNGFSYASFGEISDFYVSFFRVTYWETDWLTTAHYVSPFVVTLPLAMLAFSGHIKLRFLTNLAAVAVAFGYASITASLLHRTLFPVMVVGQVAIGIASQMLQAIPPTFTVLWFPENEIGTSLGVQLVGLYVGVTLGCALPVTITVKLPANLTANMSFSEALKTNDYRLTAMYGSLFALAMATTAYLCVFMEDWPEHPPTRAQALKRKNQKPASFDRKMFAKVTKDLLSNRSFLLATAVYGVCEFGGVQFTEITQVLKPVFKAMRLSVSVDQAGGYLLLANSVGGILAPLLLGKVFDKYKNYTVAIRVISTLGFVAACCFSLAWWQASYAAMLVADLLVGFSARAVMIPAMEVATQETYPIDETYVGIWLSSLQTPLGIVAAVIARALHQRVGSVAVMIFFPCLYGTTFVLGLFVKSDNKRLLASETARQVDR